ncbi:AraC family transcriptional regulator [Chitinophaga filiformis]|uniref:AraC family transcriptional regulator n=1 Tax=Chitinophaga filiformis TaxID=104663 RepID=A0ABY4HWD1_CHIFI|nr:AraC family transcriptional regulator [Chitinophaga filiformis]UPK68090.1 AraC family transcriptional regulator [Chitinophaga filiformis]
MIQLYENFNQRKAKVELLYADDAMNMAFCQYRRSSEDAFFMPYAALTYVREGRKVVFLNGECYDMKAGDALFVPKNSILYSDIIVKREPFVSLNLLLGDADTLLSPMACHIADRMQLQHYASAHNMSLSTFKRWFKKNVGCSPGQWMIEKRLQQAKYLLQHKGLSVKEACYRSGFEDVSYFIRRYKQAFGHTPGQLAI